MLFSHCCFFSTTLFLLASSPIPPGSMAWKIAPIVNAKRAKPFYQEFRSLLFIFFFQKRRDFPEKFEQSLHSIRHTNTRSYTHNEEDNLISFYRLSLLPSPFPPLFPFHPQQKHENLIITIKTLCSFEKNIFSKMEFFITKIAWVRACVHVCVCALSASGMFRRIFLKLSLPFGKKEAKNSSLPRAVFSENYHEARVDGTQKKASVFSQSVAKKSIVCWCCVGLFPLRWCHYVRLSGWVFVLLLCVCKFVFVRAHHRPEANTSFPPPFRTREKISFSSFAQKFPFFASLPWVCLLEMEENEPTHTHTHPRRNVRTTNFFTPPRTRTIDCVPLWKRGF